MKSSKNSARYSKHSVNCNYYHHYIIIIIFMALYFPAIYYQYLLDGF